MTPPTTSPLLTLATLQLAGGAVPAPVSGVVAALDGAPAPDFAAALAGLLTAPVIADGRPVVAVPGKALPFVMAKAGAKTTDAAPLIAPLTGEAPSLPVAAKLDAADKDTPPEQGNDDPTLDPALCWLMPPVETVPVTKAQSAPLPPVRATTTPLPQSTVAAAPLIATAPVAEATAARVPAITADSGTAEVPVASTRAARPVATAQNAAVTPDALGETEAPVASPPPQSVAPGVDAPQAQTAAPVAIRRAALVAPALVAPQLPTRTEAPAVAASVLVTPLTASVAPAAVVAVPTAPPQSPTGRVAALPAQQAIGIDTAARTPQVVAAPAVSAGPTPSAAPVLAANSAAAPPAAAPTALAPAVSVAPRPAAEVFAEALAAPAPRRAQPDQPDFTASALQSAAQLSSPIAVQQTGDAQQAGIDLTRDPGIHKMIDHIEHLRDAADARDTRIRLIPDSLGPVGVSVRQNGERITVHFTADQATTRALIADAQPRLNEIAEARGVRITQTTVDAGTGGNQPRPQPQTAAASPSAPPRAENETEDSSDARVA